MDIQSIKFAQVVYSFLFGFRFSIRYRVSIRFRFRFFKYSFYYRVVVLLVLLYTKLKLLLSLEQYSYQGQFIGFRGISRSLVDISRNLIFVEFSKILRLVESSRFLRCRIDISGNLRLVDLSRFPRFQFRVRAVYYRVFLFIIQGGKQKLKVILINNYLIQLYLELSKDYQVTQGSNKEFNLFFIVKYQFFQYIYTLSLSFYLVQGSIVVGVSLQSLVGFLYLQQILVEILYQWNLVKSLGQ